MSLNRLSNAGRFYGRARTLHLGAFAMSKAESFQALDDQQFSSFHWRAVLTTALGVFTDFYDNTTIGMVLPMVLASFGIAHVRRLPAGP
jgi:hypothetical protein